VDLIVVTDSEGILGIGDQGVGGILISIGKGNIYSLGGGIDPSRILPVVIDVGTDNPALLYVTFSLPLTPVAANSFRRENRNDPLYLGLRRSRIRGAEYDAFVDQFCDLVREMYPQAMLHFEDFGVANASRLLRKFRPKQSCCTFNLSSCLNNELGVDEGRCTVNDDMQGTAAVVLSALVSACKVTKTELKDQRIAMFGFGTSHLHLAQ